MTGKLRRLRALVRKEIRQIVRDPSAILIAFVLPSVLLFLFGYGVSLDTKDVRIGLVDESPSATTGELVAGFRGSRYFRVREGRDRRAFEDDLVSGRVRGIVVIPADFTDSLAAGRPASVQVLVDGTDPNTAKFVRNYVQATLASWAAIKAAELGTPAPAAGVTVEQRFWFNAELSSRAFLVPGAIPIVMTIVGTLLTSLVIAREWERGTMEAVMATPVTAGELLLGKTIPYFGLGLVSVTVCWLVAVLVFGIPFRGSWLGLYAVCSAFLLPALGLGMLISAVTRNQFLASQVSLIIGFLPSFLLSGFIFEIDSMPAPIRALTLAVPARHVIPSIQSAFLAGDIWPMYLGAMAVLVGMGAALMAAAAAKTRKRID